MNSVFFSPHHDDETLFGAYLLLEHDPHVIIVLGHADLQGKRGLPISPVERTAETVAACGELGVTRLSFWPQPDSAPDWEAIEAMMRDLPAPDRVFCPAIEPGGHEDHNMVGELASKVFGIDRCVFYLTYVRGQGRSSWGHENPPEPEWIVLKHRALACYQSQIAEPSTRPWFLDTIREWTL